jgi:predicted outer membrane repeat protein
VFLLVPTTAQAATYTVTNTNDKGSGSLRGVISSAPAGSTIVFDNSLAGKTITLTSAGLTISKNLTIVGPGPGSLTISGNNKFRVFTISGSRTTVTISGLTIANGYVKLLFGAGINNAGKLTLDNCVVSNNVIDALRTGLLGFSLGGAGIYNKGTLTITNSTIENNRDKVYSKGGGGIYNVGTLAVTDSSISGNTVKCNSLVGEFGGAGLMNQGKATLTRATFRNNTATGYTYGGGGAIYNNGALTITDSFVQDNRAVQTFGAGLFNWSNGTMTVERTVITGNNADQDGGGIENTGTLTVRACQISSNQAHSIDYGGGGIENVAGNATVENTTISGNASDNFGGGVLNLDGTMSLNFTTISDNRAGSGGGVFSIEDSATALMNLTNTIVANSPAGGDCLINSGVITTATTLIEDNTCSPTFIGDPLLGPLQDNGGGTATHALLAGSPAIDQASCGSVNTDQRGLDRPAGDGCDLGAYEFQP